jgi:hypothetical protein
MTDKYWFSSGGLIDIQGISVNPNTSAKVQALCYFPGNNVQMRFVDITGDEYLAWGNDDNYIIALVGHKLGMGIRVKPIDTINEPERTEVVPFEYQPAKLPIPQIITDDNRSVHNEADIQKIQTLQEQLDEQAAKLKTITELLFKNGSL